MMIEQFTKQHKILLGVVAAVLVAGILILLSRCQREITIPEGPQTVHAVITAAPISLNRRGTHMLMTGSSLFAFAESTVVNLRPYEGQTVELIGTYELNIRKNDLPVLVVTSIKGNEEEWKGWSIPALGLELKTPKGWEVKKTASGADFTKPGSTMPVLSIVLLPLDESRFREAASLSTVEGRRAFEYGDAGSMVIGIDRGTGPEILTNRRLMLFTLSISDFPEETDFAALRERLVDSIRLGFTSDSSRSSLSNVPRSSYGVNSLPSSSGVGEGSPCGGAAGVLCPSGLYCEITDREQNIGKCARL